MLQAVSPSGTVTTVAQLAVAGLGLSRHRALYVVTDNEVGHFVGDELGPLSALRSSRACRECRRLEVLVWGTWTQTAPATSTSVAPETATASTSSRRRAMPALSARSGGRTARPLP